MKQGITKVSGIISTNAIGEGTLTFKAFGAVAGQVFNVTSVTLNGGFTGGTANIYINQTLVGQSSNAGTDIAYAISPTSVSTTEQLRVDVLGCPANVNISVSVEGFLENY